MTLTAKHQTKAPTALTAQPTATTASETKPRKANSEVRKQQNRIASRNYREKRKRKLQQLQELQQLLEDDESGEHQADTRSTSPYGDRSWSGSIGYERSVASASPHIAAVSYNFSSPQPEHSATVSQAWIPSATSYSQQSFIHNNAYLSPAQQTMTYVPSRPTTTSYPTWNTPPSTASTEYSTSDLSCHSTYPSHTYLWPSPGFEHMYTHAVNHQEAVASSFVPSWQYHTSEEIPGGVTLEPYGREYYRYEPQ